jgi:hypothetical protein
MDKVTRIKAALQGEAVDRPPVSFWGHFYDRLRRRVGVLICAMQSAGCLLLLWRT